MTEEAPLMLKSLLTQPNEDEAVYQAIAWLDEEFTAGRFVEADAQLRALNMDEFHPAVIVALLSMACHAADQLPSWNVITTAAKEALTQKVGSERAERLLRLRMEFSGHDKTRR